MAQVAIPFSFSAGATILAAEHNSNFETIYNEFNGSIENTNIKSNAAISDTKLAQISTASKVSGTALVNLANINTATAGIIPLANCDTGTTAGKLVSLDGSAKLKAHDASQLINLNGSAVTSGTIGISFLDPSVGVPSANAVSIWNIDTVVDTAYADVATASVNVTLSKTGTILGTFYGSAVSNDATQNYTWRIIYDSTVIVTGPTLNTLSTTVPVTFSLGGIETSIASGVHTVKLQANCTGYKHVYTNGLLTAIAY